MTSNNSGRIIIAIVGVLLLVFVWYFFIDTLTFSELVGKEVGPQASIFINLFDFDTGLTRYDVYILKSKSQYWERRMQEVASIQDPKMREIEHERLIVEMMQDSTMKKIAKKVLRFGTDFTLNILKAVSAY